MDTAYFGPHLKYTSNAYFGLLGAPGLSCQPSSPAHSGGLFASDQKVWELCRGILPQRAHHNKELKYLDPSLGSKDHINTRIFHSGSRAEDDEDSGNHGLQDRLFMIFWAPNTVKQNSLGRCGAYFLTWVALLPDAPLQRSFPTPQIRTLVGPIR